MNTLIALAAALSGYLIGSLSFTRIIINILAPGTDITSPIQHKISGSDKDFSSSSVSATSARFLLGTKYGCLVGILDILKALIPSLIFKLWKPDTPYYLLTATFAIVGHNYPIYYKFIGGRGYSTLYGGFFVLDWVGVLVTNTIAIILGGLVGELLLMHWAGSLLMIPWIWFRTHDLFRLGYVLIANLLFWLAMLPDLKHFFQLRKAGEILDQEEVAKYMGISSLYRFISRFSIKNLFTKKRNR